MNTTTPQRAGSREWIGLAVIALPCLLYSMDLTVLHLAVPSLTRDLAPSSAQLLWIVDIYGFLVAGFLITMGTLGDRIGRRRLLLIGAAAFGLASVLAAFANSAETLIAARAALGIAGATLAPSTLSLIRNMFLDPSQRTVAISVWATSFSVGGAIGPLLGGLLLEYFWWGSVFLVGVPVMVMLLILGPLLLPEFRDPQAGRVDVPSALLSLAAVLAIIYGIKLLAQDGVQAVPVLSIVVGLFIGSLFLRRQRRLADPLIDVRLFRVPAFSAALATNTLSIFVAFAAFFFIAQYLQLMLGLSPLQAGLWTAPSSLGFVIGSMMAPALVRWVSPASAITGGLTVTAAGLVLLTLVGQNEGLAFLVTGSVVVALGIAPAVTLSTDLIVSTAPPERAGVASALSETGVEFGGALGMAVLGSIGAAIYRIRVSASIPDGLSEASAEAARGTLGGALQAAGQLADPSGAELVGAARVAFAQAFEVTAIICASVALILAVTVGMVLRRSAAGATGAETARV